LKGRCNIWVRQRCAASHFVECARYLVFADQDSAERFVAVSAPSRRPVQAAAGVERKSEFVIVDVLADVDADAGVPASAK
jgi:hypothetical protein